MNVTSLSIAGAFLIEPTLLHDERGAFARIFCARTFRELGLNDRFDQRSISFNAMRGTLRGMHFQSQPFAETKIVRCTAGAVYDVVLDLRQNSATYRNWVGTELTAMSRRSLYIPPGCAHGFLTLEDNTEVYYEISPDFEPSAARGVRWDDRSFAIDWPFEPVLIGEKDRNWPLLQD